MAMVNAFTCVGKHSVAAYKGVREWGRAFPAQTPSSAGYASACNTFLHKYSRSVTGVEPLSSSEESLWRALMRIVKVVPRHLDADLVRGCGLSANEYSTLMHLSEAPNRELRMNELAGACDLSSSRMTRLVDDLQSRSLLTKTASSTDARGNVARLSPEGMRSLKAAWPVHLESVRMRFLDYMDPKSLKVVAEALTVVADQLDECSPRSRRTPGNRQR